MDARFDTDLAIIGAGPAGLALATALAPSRMRILIIDRAPLSSLADPAFDGREIALTQASVRRLTELGAWRRIPRSEIAPLRQARVLDGQSRFALALNNPQQAEPLGWIVSNQAIRRALFEIVSAQHDCEILSDLAAASANGGGARAQVSLSDGRTLAAKLVVAADTRFSTVRKAAGIGAFMHDFGRTMLVCRMAHAEPHNGIATEWFGHAQTVAMLPLGEGVSSYVLTLPACEIAPLLAMPAKEFAADARARTQERWGRLELVSTRHEYPLTAVYAHRFSGERLALVGDAAVGMHPVTAHGFNFGLAGAWRLATLLRHAASRGADIGAEFLLRRYALAHRLATWPLFTATNAVASLFTEAHPAARLARASSLRFMQTFAPLRRSIEQRICA